MNTLRYVVMILAAVVGFVAGVKFTAIDAEQCRREFAEYRADIAKEQGEAATAEAERLRAELINQKQRAEQHARNLEKLSIDNNRLRDRIRRERVRVCEAEAVPATADGKAGAVTGAGVLQQKTGSDLVSLSQEADQMLERLRVCEGEP